MREIGPVVVEAERLLRAFAGARKPDEFRLTIDETLGALTGKTLAFIGDGNNVARSLATATALCGMKMVVGAPAGYELPAALVARLTKQHPQA